MNIVPGELQEFRDIHPELFTKIMRERPELSRFATQLDKRTREQASQTYLTEECERPFNRKEIIDTIMQASKNFFESSWRTLFSEKASDLPGVVIIKDNKDFYVAGLEDYEIGGDRFGGKRYYSLLAMARELITYDRDSYRVSTPLVSHIKQNALRLDEAFPVDFEKGVELGLFVGYNAWRRRVGCMKMDPDYAKKRLIRRYNEEIAPELQVGIVGPETVSRAMKVRYIYSMEVARDMKYFYSLHGIHTYEDTAVLLENFDLCRLGIMNEVITLTGAKQIEGTYLLAPLPPLLEGRLPIAVREEGELGLPSWFGGDVV